MTKEHLFCPSERSVGGTVRSSIMQHIMQNGSFMVPEIATATGFSLTTVAKYVSEMLAAGQIVETDRICLHAKGRRTVRYGVRPEACPCFMGVDMRAFELNIGLVDFVGQPVRIERHMDFRLENTRDTLDEVCRRIQRFVATLDGIAPERIAGININVPGRVNSRTGTSATTFNFEETVDTPLTDILSERLGMRVFIENDTKAMAYGAYMSGLNRQYDNLLYINIGWGLGLGIVIDGKLCHGKDGYSGEFGHIHMYNNNILCHCGKTGCIETEVSGRAIQRKLIERIHSGEASLLAPKVRSGETVTTADIIEAVEEHMPVNKTRYLMGVGTPSNIIEAVARGVDFFDCVMPARNARHARLFTWEGAINLKNAKYITDSSPIDPQCDCPVCRRFSRAYIRHLFIADEMLAMRLAVMHNLYFYNKLMERIRDALDEGRFAAFRAEYSEKLARRI